MARHRRHNRHHRRRRNPLGLDKNVLVGAGYNAAGALSALWLSSLVPGLTGWAGVGATGAAAVAASFAGKMLSPAASEELLKGGLTATIIKALHQAGVAPSIGLGLYSPSWFAVPTSSNAYMRTYPGNQNTQMVAVPASAVPALAAGKGVAGMGMGYHRFRSRYQGNY